MSFDSERDDWTDLDASIAFDAAWEDDDPDQQFQCENCGQCAQRPALIVWEEDAYGEITREAKFCEACFRACYEPEPPDAEGGVRR